MIPFALETLPLHYTGVPQKLKHSALSFLNTPAIFPAVFPKKSTLVFWHRRRLCYSCRLLGLPNPPVSLWETLDALRMQLPTSTQFIYSLRYFGTAEIRKIWQDQNSMNLQQGPKSQVDLVAKGKTWLLLRRKNLYNFDSSNTTNHLPVWASLKRVALAPLNLACHQPTLWRVKCHWQVQLVEKLRTLQQQTDYATCEDILRLCPENFVLEGIKTNFFLLKNQRQRWHLSTPCNNNTANPLLCGTTRNWLCHNATKLNLSLTLKQQNISIHNMVEADGLLVCNAAMGLRLVHELKLFPCYSRSTNCYIHQYQYENLGSAIRQLLAMYWLAPF